VLVLAQHGELVLTLVTTNKDIADLGGWQSEMADWQQ